MTLFITIVHILVCLALIAVVLLQQGKGADIGAAFGAGASQTVFGGRGAGSFLSKLTTGAAIVFMLTSLTLTYFANPSGVLSDLDEPEPPSPAAAAPVPGSSGASDSGFAEPSPLGAKKPGEAPSGFEQIPAPSKAPRAPEAPTGGEPDKP
ncbi:MAG: preprotein translocase subunit SecG [Myxococcota bacterium]